MLAQSGRVHRMLMSALMSAPSELWGIRLSPPLPPSESAPLTFSYQTQLLAFQFSVTTKVHAGRPRRGGGGAPLSSSEQELIAAGVSDGARKRLEMKPVWTHAATAAFH